MKTIQSYLKCPFTPEEMSEMSMELARATQEGGELKQRKKEIVKDLDSQVAAVETKLGELSRKINQGYEFRNVDCEVVFNTPKRGWKTVTRIDTGEVVKECLMSDEDRQGKLPMAGNGADHEEEEHSETSPEPPAAVIETLKEEERPKGKRARE